LSDLKEYGMDERRVRPSAEGASPVVDVGREARHPDVRPSDTAPPCDPNGAVLLKAALSRAASSILVPVLQRFARDQIGGATLDDAMAVARSLAARRTASILGFWDTEDYSGRDVAEIYLAAIARLNGSGLDAYLSLKAPALRFDLGAAAGIATAARQSDVRLHFDSHAPDAVEASHAMLQVALDELGAGRVGTTIPGRWTRSVTDVEWALERGLSIRVVKGQWPDPSDQRRDLRAGFLDIVERAAGRARHVAVATHDMKLAGRAIARLRAAGTSCELEQILGVSTASSAAVAFENAISVRVYVPFGRGYAPNALGLLRRNPRLAWTVARQMLGARRPMPDGPAQTR
jgi:proline dehydrogenase